MEGDELRLSAPLRSMAMESDFFLTRCQCPSILENKAGRFVLRSNGRWGAPWVL